MKKVFAFLSVLALTLAVLGFATKPAVVNAADPQPGMWIVDPTLEPGEIPLYVAGSAKTTFPNYFDIDAAKGTPYEDRAHRVGDVYPWNETKLIIPRYDAEGNKVGTYSVYPLGSNKATGPIAGQMIWKWISDGQGGAKVDATFGWVSLSQVRHNVSGVDVTFMTSQTRTGETEGKGSTTAHMVFDGNGRAVRGLLGAAYFQAPDPANPDKPHFTPIFGYKNGEIVKIVNGDTSELDRVMVQTDEDDLTKPLLDELGNPVLDENGNPMYEKKWVETEDPALFYKRILWQYFEAAPEELNTVGYMQPGWRADYWDYYDPEEKIAYMFLEGDDGKYGTVNQEQADIHNATLGLAEGDPGFHTTNTTRKQFLWITVPNGGTFYDFGYLERIADGGKEYDKFFDIYVQGLKYGRSEGYQMVKRAYNFSAKPLELIEDVFDETPYMVLPNTKTYEVKPGTTLKPSWLVNISGMLGGFTDLNDIFSYKNLPESELEIEVDIDGKLTVYDIYSKARYRNREEMVTDFVRDFYIYLKEDRPAGAQPEVGTDVDLSSFENFAHGTDKTSGFEGSWVLAMQDYVMWENNAPRPTAGNNPNFFITHPKYYEKWLPLFDVFDEAIKIYSGSSSGLWGVGAYTPTRRVNLYVQNKTLGDEALSLVPENWIYKPHEYKFETWNELLTEFLTDFYNYLATKNFIDKDAVSVTDFIHGEGNTEGFAGIWPTKFGTTSTDPTYGQYPLWGHYAARPTKGADNFFGQHYDKWMWFLDYFHEMYVEAGVGASFWSQSAWTPSVNFANYLKNPNGFFSEEQKDKLAEKDLYPMTIYVEESGYVEVLPPAYRDLTINVGDELNRTFVIDVRVYNKATGLSSSIRFELIVTDTYTPILEIDTNKLYVPFGQKTIDIYSIAKAYDRNYSKTNKNLKGNDISRFVQIDTPAGFDPNNLTQGKHEVKFTIQIGDKIVSKRVFIVVPDVTRPVVETRDLYLPNGAAFNPVDGIMFAFDNVDGNLFNAPFRWYAVTRGDDIDTTQAGEYTVELIVTDIAGNTTTASYTVYVFEKDTADIDTDELLDDIRDIVEDVVGEAPQGPAIGCSNEAAAYFISIIAVLGVALLVFRKRQ
jgi:hypothetical protein